MGSLMWMIVLSFSTVYSELYNSVPFDHTEIYHTASEIGTGRVGGIVFVK